MKTRLSVLLVVFVVTFGVGYAKDDDEKQFGPWMQPENLGPPVNTSSLESCISISKDGLSLFFSSTRDDVYRDIYVSQRTSTDDDWGDPQPLAYLSYPGVWESCPALSLDELRLYFTRSPSTCGNPDIWVSRRKSRRDDFGWEPPVNLGCQADGYVNGPRKDLMPAIFEDQTGTVIMYFASTRPGSDGLDLYASEMGSGDTFGWATPVAELNSEYADGPVAVRRDGLEVIFGTNRPGGNGGGTDLWVATRESTFDSWSSPVFIEALSSDSYDGGKMSFSFDGTELYFRSNRAGGYGSGDLYVARRERLRGHR